MVPSFLSTSTVHNGYSDIGYSDILVIHGDLLDIVIICTDYAIKINFLISLAPIISYFTVKISFPIEFDNEFDYTYEI